MSVLFLYDFMLIILQMGMSDNYLAKKIRLKETRDTTNDNFKADIQANRN